MAQKMKLKDIASILGVSPATVSRALKNDQHISVETRKKVFELANANRVTTENNESKNIFYLMDKAYFLHTSNFYNPLIEAIENTVQDAGYQFHFLTIQDADALMNSLNYEEIAGIIITSPYIENIIPVLKVYGIPIVLLDSYIPTSDIFAVIPDNDTGVFRSIEYLRSNGHVRIGCLYGPKDDVDCVDRYYAYRKWMDMFGMEVREDEILNCQLSMSSSYEKMMAFLNSHKELPTAFVGANDMVTIGAMQAVKDFGLKVPEDISFIGFDGISLAEEVTPSLTTVSVDRFAMGSVAVSYIIDRIEKKGINETDYHKILVNPVIKEGGSVSTITENSVVYRKNRKLIQ